jgi:superfamily II DNA or RNA helicase
MRRNKIFIRESVYIPVDEVKMSSVKKNYEQFMYEENMCRTCEYKPERYSDNCESCPGFKGHIILYDTKIIKGKKYVRLPIGDKSNIERKARINYDDFKIVDFRTQKPFDYKIKFIAKLREHQQQLADEFLKFKYGMLKAPPRFGKNITSLKIMLELGQRVILLAGQHEYLDQFLDHLHGNEEEGIPKCTNLPELEKKYGKKLYGFPKKDVDFENFQFIAMTWQSFVSEVRGKNRLKLVNENFGTLWVDEADLSSSNYFSKTVGAIKARYKFGVSGTIERKDGKHFVAASMLGPVVAESKVEALTPTVYVHETPVEGKYYQPGRCSWTFCMQYIAKHEKRNEQIVNMILKDLKNGHNIVIPVNFIKHATDLKELVNNAYGKPIAECFVGGQSKREKDRRKAILTEVKANKIKVLIGTRKLLQRGLNVPSWSCSYLISPISNEPNLRQETKRVCTPKEGKRSPIIRLFADKKQPQSLGCARSTIKHMMGFKYQFAASDKQRLMLKSILMSGRKRPLDEDEYVPYKSHLSLKSDGILAKRKPTKRI